MKNRRFSVVILLVVTILFSNSTFAASPIAFNWLNYRFYEDTVKTFPLKGSDADAGDTLTYTLVTQPSHGTLTQATAGSPNVTYTPTANYNGYDSFTFQITDAAGHLSNVATIGITLLPTNDRPTANAINASTSEDVALEIPLQGVDVDGDALSYSIYSRIVKGSVSVSSAGIATFTPTQNTSGTGSFYYRAYDGVYYSAWTLVNVSISAVNDGPVAVSSSTSVDEDLETTVTLSATDVENNAISSYQIHTYPAHGSVVLTGNSLVYKPRTNFNGSDSIKYTATDSLGATSENAGVISLTVNPQNDAPEATFGIRYGNEDSSFTFDLHGTDVDEDALSYTLTDLPENGTATLSGSTVTYTPSADFSGVDRLKFTANDGTLTSETATISLAIANDMTDAGEDYTGLTDAVVDVTINEDSPQTFERDDPDYNGTAVTYTVYQEPSSGAVEINNNQITYTPYTNYNGPDKFVINHSDREFITFNINVVPVNDAPLVNSSVNLEIVIGYPYTIEGITDPEGDPVTISLPNPGTHSPTVGANEVGNPTLNLPEGAVAGDSYTLDARLTDSFGADTDFTLTIVAIDFEPLSTDCSYLVPSHDSSTTYVYGQSTYLRNGNLWPSRRSTVLMIDNFGSSQSTLTDDQGCYAFSLNNTENNSIAYVDRIVQVATSNITHGHFADGFGQENCNGAAWNVGISDTDIDEKNRAAFSADYRNETYSLVFGDDENVGQLTADTNINLTTTRESEALSMHLLDAALESIELLCEGDATINVPNVHILLNRKVEDSAVGDYNVTLSQINYYYGYDNLTIPSNTIGHEMGHHFAHQVYQTARDMDELRNRENVSLDHNRYDMSFRDFPQKFFQMKADPRLVFFESYANMVGDTIGNQFGETEIYPVPILDRWSERQMIYSEYYTTELLKTLYEQEGYAGMHAVLLNDIPTAPVFQTSHAFAYYYKTRFGYPNAFLAFMPEAALADIYDNAHVITPLYTRIVWFPYSVSLCGGEAMMTLEPDVQHSTLKEAGCFGDYEYVTGSKIRILNNYPMSTVEAIYINDAQTDFDWFVQQGFLSNQLEPENILLYKQQLYANQDLYSDKLLLDADRSQFYRIYKDANTDFLGTGANMYDVDWDEDGVTGFTFHTPHCSDRITLYAYQNGVKYDEVTDYCPSFSPREGESIVEAFMSPEIGIDDHLVDASIYIPMDKLFDIVYPEATTYEDICAEFGGTVIPMEEIVDVMEGSCSIFYP